MDLVFFNRVTRLMGRETSKCCGFILALAPNLRQGTFMRSLEDLDDVSYGKKQNDNAEY